MDFYTNVQCSGNYILYRGIVDGKRIREKFEYKPSLFEPSNTIPNSGAQYKTLFNQPLKEMVFESIREARDYVKDNKSVQGKKIYGNTRFEYNYIADTNPGMIEWDKSKIVIAVIDIEVGSENGFPDIVNADEPITAIALKYIDGPMYVFGCGEYETKGSEIYIKCEHEYDLCKKFLEIWTKNYPDIITGWNIKFFDFPYLIHRFKRVLDDRLTRKLSPWNYIGERTAVLMGKDHTVYDMVGISVLDYIELYRKYAPAGQSQESYKLDRIAASELGKNKISYDDYDSLHDLYKKNFQLFIEYNIVDVELVEQLEDKLKLIELALTLAYDSKTNYDDVFAQVRMWDILIYNYLRASNIQIPPNVHTHKNEAFEGAYVKDPILGLHEFIESIDLDSLYPHLMMQYNISPEMLVEPEDYDDAMVQVLESGVNVERLLYRKVDTSKLKGVTITPNGQFFYTEKRGFLPEMMFSMYNDRKVYKKKALQAKQELENETNPDLRFEIEKRIARYNNLQLAKKVCLNSAYGALGNEWFRFFDVRQAAAITLSGQLSIRWIENKLNGYLNKVLKSENVDYVIASDTDSIYLNLGPLVNSVCPEGKSIDQKIAFMDRVHETKIQPFIDRSYQELAEYVHAYEQKMSMKREALADKGIWTAKKRYILNVYNNEGVQYKEPKIKVMGLEMVKSSTPAPVRKKMEEAIKIMLRGTQDELYSWLDEFKVEFFKLPPEDISFPRGIRGIEKYSNAVSKYSKGTPIHVKGAILYNHALKENGLTKKYPAINEGEKIKFAYLKMPNPLRDTVISFPVKLPDELGLNKYIDYEMQFEKTFVEPIKIILDCIGWNTEKQNTLEDFFA